MLPLDISLPTAISVHKRHVLRSVVDWEKIVFDLSSIDLVDDLHFVGELTEYNGFPELADYANELGFRVLADVQSFRMLNPKIVPPHIFSAIDTLVLRNPDGSHKMDSPRLARMIGSICESSPGIHIDIDNCAFRHLMRLNGVPSANILLTDEPLVSGFLLKENGDLVRRTDGETLGNLAAENVEAVFGRRWTKPILPKKEIRFEPADESEPWEYAAAVS